MGKGDSKSKTDSSTKNRTTTNIDNSTTINKQGLDGAEITSVVTGLVAGLNNGPRIATSAVPRVTQNRDEPFSGGAGALTVGVGGGGNSELFDPGLLLAAGGAVVLIGGAFFFTRRA